MDKPYDLAFSLGQACACSMSLRTARLQYASFPLDWIAGGTLADRVKLIAERFSGWLEEADFAFEGTNSVNGFAIFRNRRTGFYHLHDFPDASLEKKLPEVVAKYARREKRLFSLIGRFRRVLVTYIDKTADNGCNAPSTDDTAKARNDLMRAFPNAEFDFIHFILDRGIPFEQRVVTHPSEGITEVRFDYHDDIKDVSCTAVASALVSMGITVRDYRTRAERNAHRLKKQMKKYGVNTSLGLFLAKAKDRLCRLIHGNSAAERQRMP